MNYAEHCYGSDNLWKLVIFHDMLNVKTNKQLVKHYTEDYHYVLHLEHALLRLFRLKMNQSTSASGIELEVYIPPDRTGV